MYREIRYICSGIYRVISINVDHFMSKLNESFVEKWCEADVVFTGLSLFFPDGHKHADKFLVQSIT